MIGSSRDAAIPADWTTDHGSQSESFCFQTVSRLEMKCAALSLSIPSNRCRTLASFIMVSTVLTFVGAVVCVVVILEPSFARRFRLGIFLDESPDRIQVSQNHFGLAHAERKPERLAPIFPHDHLLRRQFNRRVRLSVLLETSYFCRHFSSFIFSSARSWRRMLS